MFVAIVSILFAAVSVAFPRNGMVLPHVDRCYVIGAADSGTGSVAVNGKSFPVYRTGAWAAMAELKNGRNVIDVNGETNVVITVSSPPKVAAGGVKAPPRDYDKLPYAGDRFRGAPTNRAPGEILVWLDPGHGGPVDRGCVSPHNRDEKEATLLLARAVGSALIGRGYTVAYTRTIDRAVPLYERARKAHAIGAAAFVSIHYNAPAYDKPATTRYAAVYSWGKADGSLAATIGARLGTANAPLPSDGGVRTANFAVTRSPELPSCLVEVDFLTSPEGEEAAFDPTMRRRAAEAVAAGIDDWCAGRNISSVNVNGGNRQ